MRRERRRRRVENSNARSDFALSPFQARRLSVDVLDLDDFARDILGRDSFFNDEEDEEEDDDDEEEEEENAEDEEPQDVKRGAAR